MHLPYLSPDMKTHADQRYIQALLENDTRLIQEIYRDNAGQVSRWIQKNSGSVADAQDIFQEALTAIYIKAAKGNFKLTAPFGALLMQICKNKWIDRLRKKSRSPEVRIEEDMRYEDTAVRNLTEETETAYLREQILEQTFEKLSDLCRRILQLLAEGIAAAEVATRADMSNANTVYRRKKACTDRWRELYRTAAERTGL